MRSTVFTQMPQFSAGETSPWGTVYAFGYDADLRHQFFVGENRSSFPWSALAGKRPTDLGPQYRAYEDALRQSLKTGEIVLHRSHVVMPPRLCTIVPLPNRSGLLVTVRWVHPLIEEVAESVLAHNGIDASPFRRALALYATLTDRQREVLMLLTEYSVKEAAAQLKVSRRAVEEIRAAALKKLGLRTVNELFRFVLMRVWPLVVAVAA